MANHYLAEMRDTDIQSDRMRFRRNMERIGELLAYEISRHFNYKSDFVRTPLGESECYLMEKQPILITILRAGIPFFNGFMNMFDNADAGFIGAYRGDYDSNGNFEIEMGYEALPDIAGRNVIMADPMLATGKSILKAVNLIFKYGKPGQFHIATLIAAEPGLNFLRNNLPEDVYFWIGDLDKDLNIKSYIIPGLGDAGDLSYGEKL